ncbi:MAG: class I SAM-dependent methyltransferase [Myxococcota bacterium]
MSDALRERLYASYVSAGQAHPPATLAGLAPRLPYLRKLVDAHFPSDRDARVLEVGCGYGALVHVARERGYANVAGVDVSAEQVAAARALGIDDIAHGDVLAALAAQPAGALDAVVAFDVLEHFSRDELIPLVDAVHRALAPGGRWIVHVPNGESPFFGQVRYGDLTHELAFTRQSLRQLLLASGFARVDVFEDAPVPHGLRSRARAVLWSAIRTALRVCAAAETGEASGHVFTRNLLAVAFKPPAAA